MILLIRGEVKLQKTLHNKVKSEWLLKIIKGVGINEVSGAGIYLFYTCLTYWDFDKNAESSKDSLRLVPQATKVGKVWINKYLLNLYQAEITDNNHPSKSKGLRTNCP